MHVNSRSQQGFTLIELVVFLVVISIGLGALLITYNQSVSNSVDPLVRVRLLELAQSQLDEISARKYDENTPTGGIPACGSAETGATACAGFGLDAGEDINDSTSLDDVDDFAGYSATRYGSYTVNVAVSFAGGDIGVANNQAKLVTVTVASPTGDQYSLSSYRTNF